MHTGEPGLSGSTAGGWTLVSKRRRRRPRGSGGSDLPPPRAVAEKYTRFCNFAEVYDIVDSGYDEFTFDNGIASQRIVPKVGRAPSEEEMLDRHYKCGEATVLAHHRALVWISGIVRPQDFVCQPIHRITFDGRRPSFERCEDQENADEEFYLEVDQVKAQKYLHYAEKEEPCSLG